MGNLRVSLALAALLSAACQEGPSRIAGGASETEATVAGRILLPDGTPAGDVAVRLRPSQFLRDTALAGLPKDAAPPGLPGPSGTLGSDGRTDARGFFRFDSLFLGDYSIEAVADGDRGVRLRASVTGGGKRFETDDGVLAPHASLRGRIALPAGAARGAYVQVYGLDRAARADTAGAFLLANLPPGAYSLRVTPVSAAVSARSVHGVVLSAGSALDLGEVALAPSLESEDYRLWLDSAEVRLDLAAAGVTEGLRGFPLLVRLDRSNFDFTASTGHDLRFASAGGKPLPYEIERWSPFEGKAEIWVRTDTLAAGDTAARLRLYWNRPGAPGRSDGAAVFDSAEGWQGVWHLGRDPADPDPIFRDASGQGNHASGEGLDSAGQAAGAVHLGQDLDGRTQSLQTSKPYAGPDEFTLSLWFHTTTASGGRLAGFGSHQEGYSSQFDRHLWMDNQGRVHFGVYPKTPSGPAPGVRRILSTAAALNDGRWHHVAARLSPAGQFLYVDGVLAGSDPSVTQSFPYPGFWRFGWDNLGSWEYQPSTYRFRGVLDEIRVTRAAWPAGALRLAYENQKPGSTLVSVRRTAP